VHVTIDEARQHQVAADIEDRHAVRQRRRGVLADRRDPPAGDPDIDEAPIGEAAMGQECVEVDASFLAQSYIRKFRSCSRRHEPGGLSWWCSV